MRRAAATATLLFVLRLFFPMVSRLRYSFFRKSESILFSTKDSLCGREIRFKVKGIV